MVFGDAAGAVIQLIREHLYRPRISHGVSLRPRRTRVKRSLGRDHELSYASTRRFPFAPARTLRGSDIPVVKNYSCFGYEIAQKCRPPRLPPLAPHGPLTGDATLPADGSP